jgi:hypothetical protein
MMGPEKLSTIREKVRASFKMNEAQLRAWFDDRLQEMQRKSRAEPTEIETLRLFRDALVKETKGGKPKRKSRRAPTRAKK